ncbi:MAG: polysaccharide deacetylase family protein [Flavobacteriaceae bacterium]|nr:polysaccharide deacetylase family protein [Flavobacteriaceae bacterium]
MYHKVSPNHSEGLTISVDKLEEQFKFLAENGFSTYHFSDLILLRKLNSPKNIVITFDDAYVNQLELAYPLMKKYGLKATFFVPLNYVGKTDEWNSPSEAIMTAEQLSSLDPKTIELGYHSYAHQKYTEMTSEEIEEDTRRAFSTAEEKALPLGPILAYPYGKFPRKNPEKEEFIKHLEKEQFSFGLRIGNRVNTFPFKKPYEVQRLDVKGEFSLKKFRRKIKYGKLL